MGFKAGAAPARRSTDCCADGALATADARRQPEQEMPWPRHVQLPAAMRRHPPACARARRRSSRRAGAHVRRNALLVEHACTRDLAAKAVAKIAIAAAGGDRASWYSLISDTSSRAYRRAPATSSSSSLSTRGAGGSGEGVGMVSDRATLKAVIASMPRAAYRARISMRRRSDGIRDSGWIRDPRRECRRRRRRARAARQWTPHLGRDPRRQATAGRPRRRCPAPPSR